MNMSLHCEHCPLCNNNTYKKLKYISLNSFDNSLLYNEIRLVACLECGHVYNLLIDEEKQKLLKFYKTEHENLSSGALKKEVSEKRNLDLYNIFKSYATETSKILDLGCGNGSFLNFLHEHNFKKLYGFELAEHIDTNQALLYNINSGNAESLPYEDSTFDLIILDQFLEHIINPVKVMKETYRILKNTGTIIIGVPNAFEYNKYKMFTYFYIILKEHIQHFDKEHLTMLSNHTGFNVEKIVDSIYPMHSMNMPMSNIYMVCKKTTEILEIEYPNKFELLLQMINYINISENTLNKIYKKVLKEIYLNKNIYFWGIGREFFLIYSMLSEEAKKNCKFIDSNKKKQQHQQINGTRIYDETILDEVDQKDIVVVITAVYHTKTIEELLALKNLSIKIIRIFEE